MNLFKLIVMLVMISTSKSYDFSKYYLQDDLCYSPCSPVEDSLGFIYGEAIFYGANFPASSIDETMITGWFMLKGFAHMFYPLILINDNSSLLFQLDYSID